MGSEREAKKQKIERVKKRLARSAKLRQRLAAKCERLDALERRLSSPSSPRLDSERVNGSPNRDKIGDGVTQKIEIEKQIETLKADIRSDGQQLAEYFLQLDPQQELLFCLRYIDGMDWTETIAGMFDSADDFEYETDRYTNKAFKIHGRGILDLVDIMGLNDDDPEAHHEEDDGAGGDDS